MSNPILSIPYFNPVSLDPEDFNRFIPELKLTQASDTESAREYLNKCDDNIVHLTKLRISPLAIHKIRSLMIDRLIVSLFNKYESELLTDNDKPGDLCALIATGGYGREEMSLLSDIDLLLVYKSKIKEFCKPLIEKILYVLWDLKLDVGQAVRTLPDCKKMMQQDQTIFTSMLDSRLIVGNQKFFKELEKIRDHFLKSDVFRKNIIKSKIRERVSRLKKFGGSVYLLEPHLKEGEGGLRDLQFIRWLGRLVGISNGFKELEYAGYLDKDESQSLELALNYFLGLRNKMHILTRRKSDQINFDAQIKIASDYGYEDDQASLGVEKFMQSYYAVATQNQACLRTLIQKITSKQKGKLFEIVSKIKTKKLDDHFKIVNGKIAVVRSNVFEKNPTALFGIFEHVQTTGFGIHFATKELISQNLFRVDENFRRNPDIQKRFKRMMGNYVNLGKTLFAMHAVHFFDALLPEFRRVRNRMQHDVYHVYTVDTHSIFAVDELSKLYSDPEYAKKFQSFREAMLEIKRPELLSLSLLYHDIGKGEGGNHSVIGAQIANRAMSRFGFSDKDIKNVEFQVISHLLMPHLSQRRDLEDIQMITEFAKAMGTLQHLNILYVLTWADIRAVSAEAWTDWKGRLLQSLYDKTKSLILSQEKTEDYVQKRVVDVRNAILQRMESKIEIDKLQKFLESISPRYVLAHSDNEIFEHFHLITNHDDRSLLFEENEIEKNTISEILIYTLVNPRVIPLVTGVMLSLDINILTMENFVLSDGHVFIKMRVQSRNQLSLRKVGIVDALKRNLQDVFMGKKSINELIARRKQPSFLTKKPVQKAETNIMVDNDVSAYYTVIDIITHDRLGLLYDIVKCLVEVGCYVDVSKISTKVEQVVDSFYVKDIFGHKITDKAKLNEIKDVLMKVIEGGKDHETGDTRQEVGG